MNTAFLFDSSILDYLTCMIINREYQQLKIFKRSTMKETKSHIQKASTQSKVNLPDKNTTVSDPNKDETPILDQTIIIDRFHRLHHQQYRKLADLNLSQALKHKLWGFSKGTPFFNDYNPNNLVIENHPIRGRGIMTKEQFNSRQINRMRELNIKSNIVAKPEFAQGLLSTPQMRDLSQSMPEHIMRQYEENENIFNNEDAEIRSQNRLIHEETV